MANDDHHPSDLADRFQVRMPPGMRERIADEAKANNRSMNSEIVARLQASLDASQRITTVTHEGMNSLADAAQFMIVLGEVLAEMPSDPSRTIRDRLKAALGAALDINHEATISRGTARDIDKATGERRNKSRRT